MPGDPFFTKTKLLLYADGENNQTTTVDSSSSPKTVTLFNNAKISTSIYKFGGSSFYIDGSAGSRIEIPAAELPGAGLTIGTGDFVVEGYFYLLDNANSGNVCWSIGAYGTATGLYGQMYINGANLELYFGLMAPYGSTICVYTTPKNNILNLMHHIAWVRRSGVAYIYLNGVQVATGPSTSNISSPVRLRIGNMNHYTGMDNFSVNYAFYGYIDDFRLTVGESRYSANFTPPTAPFANSQLAISGTIYDNANNPCSRTVRAYRRDTGEFISSTVSNPSTGRYSIDVSHTGEINVVALDDATGSFENDRIIRVMPV